MADFGDTTQQPSRHGVIAPVIGLLVLGLTACDAGPPKSAVAGKAKAEQRAGALGAGDEADQGPPSSPAKPAPPGSKGMNRPGGAMPDGAGNRQNGQDKAKSMRRRAPVESLQQSRDELGTPSAKKASANLAEKLEREIEKKRDQDGKAGRGDGGGIKRVQGGDNFPAAAHDSFQELAVHMESADRFIEEFEADKTMERWTRARDQVGRCEVLAEGMADEFAGFPGLDEAQSTIEERRKTLEAARPGDGK